MPIRVGFNELENHGRCSVRQYVRFCRFSTSVEKEVENSLPVCAVSAVFPAFHKVKCGKPGLYTPSIHSFHRFFNIHCPHFHALHFPGLHADRLSTFPKFLHSGSRKTSARKKQPISALFQKKADGVKSVSTFPQPLLLLLNYNYTLF